VAPTEPADRVALWESVRDALFALPTYFASKLVIHEVLATDLHTFNSSLGATIEQQVVNELNALRNVWDPDKTYALYRFERQSQRFPDVVLRTNAPGMDQTPLLGIELKGWYVLAREREPSFRYNATPAVCSPFDLLVVVPWALDAVISGSPKLFMPYVVGARYAAEFKNWYWQWQRTATSDNRIELSAVNHYYPTKDEPISDRAASDAGNNFGRYSRSGAMDEYRAALFSEDLSGIPLDAWQKFLKGYSKTSGS
jgi:hypothetical protein